MKKQWRAWTADEVATLLRMRAAGHTYAEVGAALGRREASVRSYAVDNGHTSYRRPAPIPVDEVRRMRAEGKTYRDIADALGASVGAVAGVCQRHGVRVRRGVVLAATFAARPEARERTAKRGE